MQYMLQFKDLDYTFCLDFVLLNLDLWNWKSHPWTVGEGQILPLTGETCQSSKDFGRWKDSRFFGVDKKVLPYVTFTVKLGENFLPYFVGCYNSVQQPRVFLQNLYPYF